MFEVNYPFKAFQPPATSDDHNLVQRYERKKSTRFQVQGLDAFDGMPFHSPIMHHGVIPPVGVHDYTSRFEQKYPTPFFSKKGPYFGQPLRKAAALYASRANEQPGA